MPRINAYIKNGNRIFNCYTIQNIEYKFVFNVDITYKTKNMLNDVYIIYILILAMLDNIIYAFTNENLMAHSV